MPGGFNGTLSTADFGSYRIRCTDLFQGLNVISNEGEGSTRRAFYPVVTTSSSFGMNIVFASWEERERFNKWMSGFMEKISAGRGFRGAMHITVPERDFVRDAVPTGPVTYGEGRDDVTYIVNLSFVGASDPLDINKSTRKVRAYFEFPTRDRKTAKHFYPQGTQVASGIGLLAGALFDAHAPDSTPEDLNNPFNPFDDDDFDEPGDNPFNPFD